MGDYLVAATYATPSGRMGRTSRTIKAGSDSEAMSALSDRLTRRGCSKIDCTSYEKEKIS